MNWKIDTRTLLFCELSLEQAKELEKLSYDGQILGVVDMQHPAFTTWACAAEMCDRQQLLAYATVYLPRAALSASLFFSSSTTP